MLLINRPPISEKQAGFTLIELMIALLLGLIVVAVTITIYITTVRGSSDTIQSAHLNQDIGVSMSIMTNDIRRAGYWGGAIPGADLTENPFNQIEIHDHDGEVDSCITYTYDANAYSSPSYDPGSSDNPESDEYYGFRLSNNEIELKTSGNTNANCNDGTWAALTDSNAVNVNELKFELFTEQFCGGGTTCTEIRLVQVSIDAASQSKPEITKSLQSRVRVRNNRIYTGP